MLVGEEVKICQSGYSRLDFLEIDTRAGTVFENTIKELTPTFCNLLDYFHWCGRKCPLSV